jgi:hypothetical protein
MDCSIGYVTVLYQLKRLFLELNSEMQDDYPQLQRTEGKEVAFGFVQVL